MSVRNIRFYTTKGLVPPPIRRGRSATSADHVARLELVQGCRPTGSRCRPSRAVRRPHPRRRHARGIALHRTMLAPWQADLPVEMSRSELERRAGRPLTDDDFTTLAALGIVFPTKRGRYEVAVSQLSVGLGLLDLGFPVGPRTPPPTCTPSTAPDRQGAGTSSSAPWSGPSTREAGASTETLRKVVEPQAALDREPGRGLRGRDGRDPPGTSSAAPLTLDDELRGGTTKRRPASILSAGPTKLAESRPSQAGRGGAALRPGPHVQPGPADVEATAGDLGGHDLDDVVPAVAEPRAQGQVLGAVGLLGAGWRR